MAAVGWCDLGVRVVEADLRTVLVLVADRMLRAGDRPFLRVVDLIVRIRCKYPRNAVIINVHYCDCAVRGVMLVWSSKKNVTQKKEKNHTLGLGVRCAMRQKTDAALSSDVFYLMWTTPRAPEVGERRRWERTERTERKGVEPDRYEYIWVCCEPVSFLCVLFVLSV